MNQQRSSPRARAHRRPASPRTALVHVMRLTERIALLITEEVAWRTLVLLLLVPIHFPGSHG